VFVIALYGSGTSFSESATLHDESIVECAHLGDSDTSFSSWCSRHLAPDTAASLPLAYL
jgi:hypothetical protein